jgi:hypothetical protein
MVFPFHPGRVPARILFWGIVILVQRDLYRPRAAIEFPLMICILAFRGHRHKMFLQGEKPRPEKSGAAV